MKWSLHCIVTCNLRRWRRLFHRLDFNFWASELQFNAASRITWEGAINWITKHVSSGRIVEYQGTLKAVGFLGLSWRCLHPLFLLSVSSTLLPMFVWNNLPSTSRVLIETASNSPLRWQTWHNVWLFQPAAEILAEYTRSNVQDDHLPFMLSA